MRDPHDRVTRELPLLRHFRVECECDGAPFVWQGEARNEQAAIRCAALDLVDHCPEVRAEHVRATSCIEVQVATP